MRALCHRMAHYVLIRCFLQPSLTEAPRWRNFFSIRYRPHSLRLSLMMLSVPLSHDRCPDTWDTVPYISPQRLPDGAHSSASDRQRISVFRLVFLWHFVWYFCGKSQTCPTCPTCLTFKAFSPFLPLLLNRMSQVP